MNNESNYIKWFSISISIFCLLLTLWGCSSIRENEKELTLYEQSKISKNNNYFSFKSKPIYNTCNCDINKLLVNSDSAHFYFESTNFKENTSIFFYIHPNYFEENFQRYTSFLNVLKGEVNLYIYTKVPNVDLLQKVIDSYFSKNFQHQILNINSVVGTDISISSSKTIYLSSFAFSGNATSFSLDTTVFIKEIYLYPTENLNLFNCNVDSTIKVYSEGVLKNINVINSLTSVAKNLKTLDLRKSNLKEMPDMSHLQRMDMIKLIKQDIDTLDLNRFPSNLKKLVLAYTKTKTILKHSKSLQITSIEIRNSLLDSLNGTLLNVFGLENVLFRDNPKLTEPSMYEFKVFPTKYIFDQKPDYLYY